VDRLPPLKVEVHGQATLKTRNAAAGADVHIDAR
jgi:hypothetical protein